MHCINTSHPEYRDLLNSTGISPAVLKTKISVWMDNNSTDRFPTMEELNITPGTINATLKIIDVLEKIQRNVFTQDKLQGWINDLQKQGVSAQQIELFKEVAKPGMTKGEIATSIAATYSYTVEINIAKETASGANRVAGYNTDNIDVNSLKITKSDFGDFIVKDKNGMLLNPIAYKTRQEAQEAINNIRQKPSQYYSNLTVPGGTNYTENEIATPAITPSIKGHAQFATDQGIGWFRSDDKVIPGEDYDELEWIDEQEQEIGVPFQSSKKTKQVVGSFEKTKIRRILEVQSDLFQKGRDKKYLSDQVQYNQKVDKINPKIVIEKDIEWPDGYSAKIIIRQQYDINYNIPNNIDTRNLSNIFKDGKKYFGILPENVRLEYDKAVRTEYDKLETVVSPQNNFLQLLNKENNWVTFFIKSIIQDSAKKGYEKVLFPSGNTASKVEGHTTLEEFKKVKEDRIKELKADKLKVENLEKTVKQEDLYLEFYGEDGLERRTFNTLKELQEFSQRNSGWENEKIGVNNYGSYKVLNSTESIDNEINQLKQELARVETEGFGALKPIFNFYENTVSNILRKQYGKENVKVITDEYGNTWNEVSVETQPTNNTILYQVNSDSKSPTVEERVEELDKKLIAWAKKHGISVEAIKEVQARFPGRYDEKAIGIADFVNNLIALADNAKIDTLPEEIAHFAIEIMLNDPSTLRALEEVVTTGVYAAVKEEYKDIYTEEIEFRKEALAKILANEIVGQFTGAAILGKKNTFWKYLKAMGEKFLKWVKTNFNQNTEARYELENFIKPLALSILNEDYLGNLDPNIVRNAEIAYQLEEEQPESFEEEPVEDVSITQKKKFLKEAILQMADRIKLLERSAKSRVVIDNLEEEVRSLEKLVELGKLDLGISSFIELASTEITTIHDALLKAKASGNVNPSTLVVSKNFIDMYDNLFNSFIEDMYAFNIEEDAVAELKKQIHNLAGTIKDARGLNKVLLQASSIKALTKANLDHNGRVIDPTFDAKNIMEDAYDDVSAWRLLVGNYKYADSKILKAAHKIIFDSVARVQRFTVGLANTILSSQETFLKSGLKVDDLVEQDEKGNNTHYFLREYNWSKYYAKLAETKQAIADALGYENYNQIHVSLLSTEDKQTRRKLWEKFFAENTVTKVSSDLVDNVAVINKTVVPNDSYKNPKYAEMMANPIARDYYETLIAAKKDAVMKLPAKYRTDKLIYMVPPMLKSTLDRISTVRGTKSFLSTMGALAGEALFVTEDETQFGQLNVLNNKMVPIYFTRPLDDTKDLSFDLARSVTLFAEMAENFHDMNKIAGDLGTIQLTLAERNYIKGGKKPQRKKGVESSEYAALEVLLDSNVFGIERKALASKPIAENNLTKKLGIAGKQFSWTKASQRFAGFIRDNNLAFNIPSSLSGWLKGSGDSMIEDAIGLYTTVESKNWARVEFGSNLLSVMGAIGKAKQTNKMHLILQQASIADLSKMLYETNKNRLSRKLLNHDILYTTFATGDYGIKGRVTLAIYDNYRLYKGQFLTRERFYEKTAKEKNVTDNKEHRKSVSKEWSSLRDKSLYNAYEVVDGNLTIKKEFEQYVTDSVLNSVKGKVENVTTYVDGTMSPTDKGKLARSIAGDFVLMHRGWFVGMMDTRLRKEGINYITEEEEIGTYRGTVSAFHHMFWQTLVKDKAGIQASFAAWNDLSPAKKRGVQKTVLDALFLTIASFLAAIVNVAADADDEKDWTLQYAAYQMNRLLLEQGAAWSPAELVQMIDEPVVGARMIKDIFDLQEMFNYSEVYERGMYAGKSHMKKWWMKKTPFRNLYELQYPDLKNQFIKTLTNSAVYSMLSPEEANSITATDIFKNNIVPFSNGYSDNVDQSVNSAVEYLQGDTTEPNEFN